MGYDCWIFNLQIGSPFKSFFRKEGLHSAARQPKQPSPAISSILL
jgi:hypothetical protein